MGIVNERQDDLDQELNELESDIPEKYRGKTSQELIKMHQEAEQKASRLGNEIGQLRTQVLQPPVQKKEPEKKEVSVDDLLESPEDAVSTLVNQHPEVKRLNQTVEQIERDLHRRNFESQYPDFKSDITDEFRSWCQTNPVRLAMAQSADAGDFQAASALWDMWSERKALITAQKNEEKEAKRKKELKNGMLESGNGNSTENNKIFSRAEIRKLKEQAALGNREAMATVNDPKWQAEVYKAYQEGRAR